MPAVLREAGLRVLLLQPRPHGLDRGQEDVRADDGGRPARPHRDAGRAGPAAQAGGQAVALALRVLDGRQRHRRGEPMGLGGRRGRQGEGGCVDRNGAHATFGQVFWTTEKID